MTYNFKPVLTKTLIGGIILGALTAIYILVCGFSDKIGKSDVAVVLGSKVNADGSPSLRLKARLDKGIELYKKGLVNYIMVSGGIDKASGDEALAMKNYVLSQQIPAFAIIMDNQGSNTALTAKNTASFLRLNHLHSALIVSQYFHIARSRLAFSNYGIKPLYTAHANYFEWRDIYSTAREVVGLYKYLLMTYPT